MLIVMPAISFAGNKISDVTVSGYVAVDAPMHQNESWDNSVRWARVKLTGVPTLQTNMLVVVEYDFASQSPSKLYTNIEDSIFGGVVCGSAGKVVGPIGNLMPGPNSLKLIRWEHSYDAYCLKPYGVTAGFKKSWFEINSFYGEKSQVAMTFGLVSGIWEEDSDWGFILESPFKTKLLDTWFTVSFPTAGEEQYSLRNSAVIAHNLTCNAIVDYGKVDALTFGLSYEYSTQSFVKAYIDITKDAHPEFDLELICTF